MKCGNPMGLASLCNQRVQRSFSKAMEKAEKRVVAYLAGKPKRPPSHSQTMQKPG